MLDDILSETPMYQSIQRKARNEGLAEERQARLNSLRVKMLMLLQARFPQLNRLASRMVTQIVQPEVLEDLMLKLALAQSTEEAQGALLAAITAD